LALPSAAALLDMVHSGKKSCVELVTERLARIEAVNGTLNACIEVLGEAAIRQALEVDDKVATGRPLRRLEGLPIVVKCNIDVAGTLSTAATPALAEWRPLKTAPCVEPLLAAGAIVIAKTNMSELAIGFRGSSVLHGLCKNPYSTEHNAGGSSTGTAVAVAAGIVPCGLGSDTAGSLRVPAACNGGVGMRPSKGRWSGTGVVPVTNLRDTPGPMGASVGDVALLDAVMAGESTVAMPATLRGSKVVVAEDWIAEGPPLAAETRRGLDLAIAAFERVGAAVVSEAGIASVKSVAKATWEPPLPVPIEDPYADLQAYLDYHGRELPEAIRTVEAVGEKFGGGTPYGGFLQGFFCTSAQVKSGLSDEEYAAKLAERDAGIAATEEAYRTFFRRSGASCVLMPVFPGAPTVLDDPKAGLNAMVNEGAYTAHLCTVGGAPAIVLPTPVKFASCGVPVSVMLLGTDDRELIGLALALERSLAHG